MMGRLAAVCGWLAWQTGRPLRAVRLRRAGNAAPFVLAFALIVVAALPLVVPLFDPQPQDATVQEILDDEVTEPTGWVRLRGRLVRLAEAPTDERGRYGLLVDAADTLRAIAVRSAEPIRPTDSTAVTGRVLPASVVLREDLPIEATVFGTPPQIVSDRLVELDATPLAERVVVWPISIPPLLLAAVLFAGARAGYPIFRPTTEVDVLAAPLGPGERLPAAYGGRVGPSTRDLADPGGALLLVRRGPSGNLLMAQPLADDGGVAPDPVTIGGSWTTGRVGYVHTVSETVPALVIRSELVDATFLFARSAERDRVAALVSVER